MVSYDDMQYLVGWVGDMTVVTQFPCGFLPPATAVGKFGNWPDFRKSVHKDAKHNKGEYL